MSTDSLAPDNEDEPSYSFPSRPSELRSLPDEEFYRLWRKLAFANLHKHDRMVEHELMIRLIRSLGEFKRASDRASTVLIWLTVVLVLLTAAILWLTYQLD